MNLSPLRQSNRPRNFRTARILTCVLGFTLVEVLASVTIIGILIFMAIPSITSVRRDTEENMAISRAEALNMAISSYIQAYGMQTAKTAWAAAPGSNAAAKDTYRYTNFLTPYLSYAPSSLAVLMPADYLVTLPQDLANLDKVIIYKPLPAGQTNRAVLAY
jgi:prepilin-type N-terminal cleavage/methylation domain-containing protein